MTPAQLFRDTIIPQVEDLMGADIAVTTESDDADVRILDGDLGVKVCVTFDEHLGGPSSRREGAWMVLALPPTLINDDPRACAGALRTQVQRCRRRRRLSIWWPRIGAGTVAVLGLLFAFLAIPDGSPGSSCEDPTMWQDAALMVGERLAVAGEVVAVQSPQDVNGQPIFVNLGEAFPSPQRFDVPLFEDFRRRNPDANEIREGQTICVVGEINLFRGVPQIVPDAPGSFVVQE